MTEMWSGRTAEEKLQKKKNTTGSNWERENLTLDHWIWDIPLNCQIFCQYIIFWVLAKTVCIWRRAFFSPPFSWGFLQGSLTSLQRYSRVSWRVSRQMRIHCMATFQKGIWCLRTTILLRTFFKTWKEV